MTRFARAKGSKASNERKPEEATSWSEMKKSLLLKKNERLENQPPEPISKVENEEKHNEWAPLGSDSYSAPLLKQHLTKKDKKTETMGKKKSPKKRKKPADANDANANDSVNGQSKKMVKKQKMSFLERGEGEEKKMKKGKKRKEQNENDSEEMSPKKKKKMEQVDAELASKKKGNEAEVKNSKKSLKKKSEIKSKTVKTKKAIKGNFNENGNFQNRISKQSKKKSKFQDKSFVKAAPVEELIIHGEKIEIVKFQGFCVTAEDAQRLKKLRTEMKKEGIPRAKLEAAIKLERRRAEKALSRLKKSVCFHCRGHGHLLSNCPDLVEKETTGTGICYKCGSTEHSATECKVVRGPSYQFAECFICKEQGHIARQCPDNPRGLYPQGGACRECGDVTHLRKDCPNVLSKKEEEAVTVALRNDRNLECLDEEISSREKRQSSVRTVKKNSAVKF